MKRTLAIAVLALLMSSAMLMAEGNPDPKTVTYTDGLPGDLYRDGLGHCPELGGGCTGADIVGYFGRPTTNCATWLNYLRAQSEYMGEDEDYIYIKARVASQDPYTLEPDPNGTHYYVVAIHAIETYIEANCPEY